MTVVVVLVVAAAVEWRCVGPGLVVLVVLVVGGRGRVLRGRC